LFLCTDPSNKDVKTSRNLLSSSLNKVHRLLSLAAPTLSSLTLVSSPQHSGTSIIAQAFRTHFPQLLELSVVGMYPFPSYSGTQKPNLPRLERLHLNGNRNPHGLLQLGCLSSSCPSLKHLRVSGITQATSFLIELEEALCSIDAGENQNEPSALFASRLPPNLHSIDIQQGPLLAEGKKANALRIIEEQVVLERIERSFGSQAKVVNGSDSQHVVKFSVQGRMAKDYDAIQVARSEWLSRLIRTKGR